MLSTIKLGSNGDIVKVAQYMLNTYARKEATGIFNEALQIKTKLFQEQNDLIIDGIIGPATWTKMAKSMPTCSTSKNRISAYTCAIQILLGGLTVDGVYGTNTKKAVAAFQSASGLKTDGVCGPKTWTALVVGVTVVPAPIPSNEQTIDGDKVINKCVHYLQWDSKWKKVMFSNHGAASQTIGNSGCGPSSMAMIMATWIDPKITPVEMCKFAVEDGHRSNNSGTNWSFFPAVFKKYPQFSKYIATKSIETLKNALREGALAVCSMNSNDNCFWTKGGHYIVAVGVDNTYIYANDPNNKTVPRKQTHSKFSSCMKQAFIFWPPTSFLPLKKEEETSQPSDSLKKIIDISKWQGNIDFYALKKEVGLVIARASCGSDKDSKFDEYAKAMIANNIPFGVYCYSYAGTEAKAQDEAQKLIAYSSQYNPLFYIMDAEEERINTNAIKAFAEELRKLTNGKIGCYVAHHRYNQYKYSELQSLFDITWIPCYGKNDGTIAGSRKPSYDCDLWQYTSTAKIAGINGKVDMNITMKEEKPLEWFLQK